MRQEKKSVVISLWAIAILIALGSIIPQGYAQETSSTTCTLATLRGQYVFDASGYNIVNSIPEPKAVVEFLRFGGDGSLTSTATAVVNGSVVGGEFHQGTGTYTVNNDCTGALTFDGSGFTFDLFIAPHGGRFHMIETFANTVLAGAGRRVSH